MKRIAGAFAMDQRGSSVSATWSTASTATLAHDQPDGDELVWILHDNEMKFSAIEMKLQFRSC